jgi:hypothetical protein
VGVCYLVSLKVGVCYLVLLLLQESTIVIKYGAKIRQRLVRKCFAPGCEKTNQLKACGHCEVALYCSTAHQHLHRSAHESLCKELTRLCDYPDCEKRALKRCPNCKCVMYCSEEHLAMDEDAHKEICEELSDEGRRFR